MYRGCWYKKKKTLITIADLLNAELVRVLFLITNIYLNLPKY